MRNNKGLTIVEIIISVTLISIVLILILNVLITIRDEDAKGEVTSNLLMNQALITKEIESDFVNLGLVGIESCNDSAPGGEDSVTSIIPSSSSLRLEAKGNCIKFIYNSAKTDNNIGYLLYYSYGFSSTEKINIIGYRRGDVKVLRETPFLTDNVGIYKNSCVNNSCALKIDLPIYNEDGTDYGIHLSYIYKNNTGFIIKGLTNDTKYRFKENN